MLLWANSRVDRVKSQYVIHLTAKTCDWKKNDRKDRRDGKTRKKTQLVTGKKLGKPDLLEIDRKSSRTHRVETSFWKRLWIDYVIIRKHVIYKWGHGPRVGHCWEGVNVIYHRISQSEGTFLGSWVYISVGSSICVFFVCLRALSQSLRL
jgi:hypothetical protein